MTPFTDIYAMFLNDVRDLKLTNPDILTPEELGDILQDYLLEAADIHFYKCRKDLSKRDEDGFLEELSGREKRILSKAMRIKWLSSNFVANERLLSSRLTTNDYNVYSPANQLNALMKMKDSFSSEVKRMVTRYLYDTWIAGG